MTCQIGECWDRGLRSNNLQALCLLPASVSPFAPLGMSGLSELADTGFVYESGRVNAGVGNDVYELGPDRSSLLDHLPGLEAVVTG